MLFSDSCTDDSDNKKSSSIPDMGYHSDYWYDREHAKEKAKERYKIEAKNSELKHRHGYDVASSSGLIGMEMQGAMTIFAVNLKRIIKLMNA